MEKKYLHGVVREDGGFNNLQEFINDWKLYPIISVGSGNGYLEGQLKLQFSDLDIMCVDPDPESFNNISDDVPNLPPIADTLIIV